MKEQRQRRSTSRLDTYDYTSSGGYFVTMCSFRRKQLFGFVRNDRMHINQIGKIVRQEWLRTEEIRAEVQVDKFIIMPNHIHAIVFLHDVGGLSSSVGATGRSPLRKSGPKPRSLGALIAGFKSSATTRVRSELGNHKLQIWQRNYYEHILRDERDLHRVRRYIHDNPRRWRDDRFYPHA